jgi:Transglycosylase SLT domain
VGAGRSKRRATAVFVGGLMLLPALFASTGGRGLGPIVGALGLGGGSALAGPGDLLGAQLRLHAKPEDYGASGNLPESDTLSPELLAALTNPSAQAGGLDTGAGAQATVPPGPLGIPGVVLIAYQNAAQLMATENPNCGITWPVLAAIGRIESNHASSGNVDAQGTTLRPILGPTLSGGPGVAVIPDSDGGRLDGDATWDRAVGPMQFIPTTWSRWAADGNKDGVSSPHNVYDAALAAARYLCAGGGNLADPAALAQAVFTYNHSDAYVSNVLAWAAAYATGVTPLPSSPGSVDAIAQPVTPGLPADPSTPSTTPSTTPGTSTSSTTTTTTTTTPSSTTTTTTPTCPTAPTSTDPGSTSPTPPSSTAPDCPPPSTTSPSSSTNPPTSESSTAAQSSTAESSTAESSTAAQSSTAESSTAQESSTVLVTSEATPSSGTSSQSAGSTETTSSLPPS